MGLVGYDLYQLGQMSLLAWMGSIGAAMLMPYLVALTYAFLIVPPDYAGASVKRLHRRYRPETGDAEAAHLRDKTHVLRLKGFREGEQFVFDPVTGRWAASLEEDASDWEVSGCSGYADLRLTGLWKRQITFVALFLEGEKVMLRVGSQTVDLTDSSVRVTRRSWIPFVRLWEVYLGSSRFLTLSYYWADIHEWPDDEDVDIFFHVAVRSKSKEQMDKFIRFWSLARSGKSADQIAALMAEADLKKD